MANSVLFGKYLPIESIIHRLDARIKIIATLIFLISLFINNNIYVLISTIIFVMILTTTSKVGIKKLITSLKPIRILLIFMIVFNLFFYRQGEIIFEFKFLTIYDEALTRTIFFTFRIVVMILYTSILTLTTSPLELAAAIEALLNPLKVIKVPAHEIGMMISIALRFVPTLFEETELIMKAQASRGIDFKNGKIKEKVRGIVALLIPLFINSLKRASDLADSMEIRGYTGGEGRTNLNESTVGRNEYIYLIIHLVIMTLIIAARIGGI